METTQVCPICETASKLYCTLGATRYYRCPNCATIFQNPLPSVEQMIEYANREYSVGGVYHEHLQAGIIKRQTFSLRIPKIEQRASGKRVLDVGCSYGYFLDVALDHNYDAYGVEFSGEAVAGALERVRSRIIQGDANKIAEQIKEPFDIVTAFDVIEHTIDPVQFLKDAKKVLKPGGLVVITTPDTSHFLRPVMRKYWPMLQPFQHTVLFSGKSLRLALEKAGYENIELMPARKVLTADFLAEQIRLYTPLITQTYKFTARVLPQKVRNKPIPVNIGEVLAFAWAKN